MFADPGYLGDPRLPIDSPVAVRASWARITSEAYGYNPGQRETIKARIRRAAHELGVELPSAARAQRVFALEDIVLPTPAEVEEALNEEEAAANHTGCMVALFPGSGVASQLSVDGGEAAEELHVTLAYLGQAAGLDVERLKEVVAGVAQGAVPLSGEVAGLGVFTANPEEFVTYASVDLPGLPGFRQRLVDALVAASFPVATSHGYTPHMTLVYADRRELNVPNLPLEFDTVYVVAAGERFGFELRGDERPYEPHVGPAEPAGMPLLISGPETSTSNDTPITFTMNVESSAGQPAGYTKETEEIHARRKKEGATPHDFQPAKWTHPNGHPRCMFCCNEEPVGGHCPGAETDDLAHEAVKESLKPAPPEPAAPAKKPAAKTQTKAREEEVESEPEVALTRAFVTEYAGKTLLTAPLETLRAENVGSNQHFLWMEGAMVGAVEPNRNGALWSVGDLQMGEATVKNGPLNWLHEARHIIGSLADGRLVPAVEGATEGAAAVPHIRATAALWRWIYPDEAEVVEFAAQAGKLYYSMECISETVRCVGPSGCDAQVSYVDMLRGKTCAHIKERASVRQFENPTFLGAAVIVPPVRPGWAHADVNLLREAAQFTEAAWQQMGEPDMETKVLEQLVAEVVGYAKTL